MERGGYWNPVGVEKTRYSIEIDFQTRGHTKFRLFVNGGLSGGLVMRNDEFEAFKTTLGIE